jgi:cyclic beta-1,2-glucan synthetase
MELGWHLWAFGFLLVFCTSYLSIAVVNWLSTLFINPILCHVWIIQKDPAGITIVVIIPTMLLNKQNIEDLTEALEVRFLANQDKNIHFGLLTDFKDADAGKYGGR